MSAAAAGPPVGQTRSLARLQILTLCLLVTGYAGYYFCRSNLSVALPLIARELSLRGMTPDGARLALGSMASLGVLAYAIGKIPSGAMADVLGGRRNFLFGMAGAVSCTVLFAAAGTVPLFTLLWMANRLVQSLGWAGAVKIASKWFSFKRYGAVMAAVSLSYLFGDAIARQSMAWLILFGFGWRAVFYFAAGTLALILLACVFWLKESPLAFGQAEPPVNPENLFAESAIASPSIPALLRTLFASRVFLITCALSLGATIVKETFSLWTPTYFMQTLRMTAPDAASNSALFPLLGGVSVLLCGWLSDRLGRGGRAAVIFAGLLLAGVVMLTLAFGSAERSRLWTVALVSAVAFLLYGPYSYFAGAISLDFGGKQASGIASGIIDAVGYLGGTVAGFGMAGVSIRYGWAGALIALAAITFLSSATAFVFLRHERRLAAVL